MNERGHYGKNGVSHVGQAPIFVEQKRSSVVPWILGTLAVGGAVLWARHQSKQIEQLQATAGLPHQSFVGSLRQSASSAGTSLRGLVSRPRPTPPMPSMPPVQEGNE